VSVIFLIERRNNTLWEHPRFKKKFKISENSHPPAQRETSNSETNSNNETTKRKEALPVAVINKLRDDVHDVCVKASANASAATARKDYIA